MGYAKVIHIKKGKEKKRVQDMENNGYLDARLKKKEMNKIALVL